MADPSLQTFADAFSNIMAQAVAYLPRVLVAVAVLVAGWLVAKALRAASVHLVRGVDRLWHRLVLRTGSDPLPARHPPTHVVGELVFWLVLLFFVTATTQVLGLEVFTNWLGRVAAYVPVLVAGLLIVLAGLVVSSLARDVVTAAATTAGLPQGDLLGRLTQALILLTAVVVGADQVGIDIGFLTVVFGIALAALLGGVALAFGMGAREHVADLLAGRQLQQLYRAGDRIRFGDMDGTVLEIMPTVVVLETSAGRAAVPARRLAGEVSLLQAKGGEDDAAG